MRTDGAYLFDCSFTDEFVSAVGRSPRGRSGAAAWCGSKRWARANVTRSCAAPARCSAGNVRGSIYPELFHDRFRAQLDLRRNSVLELPVPRRLQPECRVAEIRGYRAGPDYF